MAKLIFLISLLIVYAAINVRAADDLELAWQKYQVEFPIKMQTKSEYGLRKSIFSETHAKIKEHNSKNDASFEMGHNAFSVMTEEEKQSYFGAVKPDALSNLTRISTISSSSSRQLPANVDYSKDPCMPPVKAQGWSDCWAFSATSIVEFGKCKKGGGSGLDFSEQILVDCVTGWGWGAEDSWKYLALVGGQAIESSYPYTAGPKPCIFSSSKMKIGAKISPAAPVEQIASNDVNAMMNVLASGRLLTFYIQLPNSFFNYKSGVFDDEKCVPGNAHSMNIVGYGSVDSGYWKFNVQLFKWEWQDYVDYWIVRNSWGSGWGDAGYVRIKKGVNLCLIETLARTTNVI